MYGKHSVGSSYVIDNLPAVGPYPGVLMGAAFVLLGLGLFYLAYRLVIMGREGHRVLRFVAIVALCVFGFSVAHFGVLVGVTYAVV